MNTAQGLRRATVLAVSVSLLAPTSALAQQSTSPSPSPTASCPYVEFSVDRHVIASGQTVTVTARRVSGAGQKVSAKLYRHSPAPEALVRSDTSTATVVTWPVRLGESHRFLAEYPSSGQNCVPLGRPNGLFLQLDVQPTVSIAATRNAPRDYAFTGRVLPGRGQRVTLWRVDPSTGKRVHTSTSTVGADGLYRFDRRFTSSGRFDFQVDVAASSANLAGRSPIRPTVIL